MKHTARKSLVAAAVTALSLAFLSTTLVAQPAKPGDAKQAGKQGPESPKVKEQPNFPAKVGETQKDYDARHAKESAAKEAAAKQEAEKQKAAKQKSADAAAKKPTTPSGPGKIDPATGKPGKP